MEKLMNRFFLSSLCGMALVSLATVSSPVSAQCRNGYYPPVRYPPHYRSPLRQPVRIYVPRTTYRSYRPLVVPPVTDPRRGSGLLPRVENPVPNPQPGSGALPPVNTNPDTIPMPAPPRSTDVPNGPALTDPLVPSAPATEAPVRPEYRELDFFAVRLEKESRQLHEAIHGQFRTVSGFRTLDRDVAQLEKMASHIHDVIHKNGTREHLRDDLREAARAYLRVGQWLDTMIGCPTLGASREAYLRSSMTRMGTTLQEMIRELQ